MTLKNKSQLLLNALYLEATLTFLRFAAKHCSIAQLFGGSYQYEAICCIFQTLQREILFNRKRKPHTMSEKRHQINKFVNYQNIIVRNSPAFYRHVFVSFQDRWSMDFDVMCMISTKSAGKTLADRFASCENIVWISFKRMYGK